MRTFTLSSGDKIPAIGLGTWKSNESVVGNAVKNAIKYGYRHIDCASIYLNEEEIGDALAQSMQKDYVKRDDLWITSKLWNSHHSEKDVEPALKETLSRLKLDYLNLYLMHWPVACKKSLGLNMPRTGDDYIPISEIPLNETWGAMEKLVSQGLVKNIGVSNFSIRNLKTILSDCQIQPAVNQIECHPYLVQKELAEFCKQHHIHITAYSPLGSPDRPEGLKKANDKTLLEENVILQIAKSHHFTPAQVLIAWQIHRGNSVIPKSTNEDRIKENLAAENIQLSADNIKRIDALDQNFRYLDASFWENEKSPYSARELWQ